MKIKLAAVLCLLLSSIAASAQVKPADAIRYRHAAFQMIVWNFAPLSGMSRGKLPFDKAQFLLRAQRIHALAPQLLEGFPKGSEVGETEAKAEIWSNWADFQLKMQGLETESKKLVEISQGGDEAAMKLQFGKLGAACKACHDKYKKD